MERPSFETFKSGVCHELKHMGDIDYLIYLLESGIIREYFDKKWYPESLYLLAMLDYLSRINDVPLCTGYDDLRKCRLKNTVYPTDAILMRELFQDDRYLEKARENAIPEFMNFNIVECNVRDVV